MKWLRNECSYKTEGDPCEYCAKRQFTCIKVYPRNQTARMQASSNIVPMSMSVPLSPSIVMDSGLTKTELYYIRKMYAGSYNDCRYSVVVQNLKDAYGETFGDKTLLYGALIWETGFQPEISSQHIAFQSRFNKAMMTAINENTISECHFFAHVFAIWGSSNLESKLVYLQGLIIVLKILNQQHETGVRTQPLRYLYHFVLLFLRRHMDTLSPPHLERELYLVTEGLEMPSRIPDSRVTHGSLATGAFDSNPDPWVMLWSWINDIRFLKATYTTFCSKPQSSDAAVQIKSALSPIRRTIVATLALPEVSAFLQNVNISEDDSNCRCKQ
jgi:hypothetical protein